MLFSPNPAKGHAMSDAPAKPASLISCEVNYYPDGKCSSFRFSVGRSAIAVIALIVQLILGFNPAALRAVLGLVHIH